MKTTHEFKAKLTGDQECFYFEVTKEEYIKLFGQDRYDDMIDELKENNRLLEEDFALDPDGCDGMESCIEDTDPQTFSVYPNMLFDDVGDFQPVKITLTYEKVD